MRSINRDSRLPSCSKDGGAPLCRLSHMRIATLSDHPTSVLNTTVNSFNKNFEALEASNLSVVLPLLIRTSFLQDNATFLSRRCCKMTGNLLWVIKSHLRRGYA